MERFAAGLALISIEGGLWRRRTPRWTNPPNGLAEGRDLAEDEQVSQQQRPGVTAHPIASPPGKEEHRWGWREV